MSFIWNRIFFYFIAISNISSLDHTSNTCDSFLVHECSLIASQSTVVVVEFQLKKKKKKKREKRRKRTYITSKVSRRIVGRKRSFVSPVCSCLEGQEIAVGIFSGQLKSRSRDVSGRTNRWIKVDSYSVTGSRSNFRFLVQFLCARHVSLVFLFFTCL